MYTRTYLTLYLYTGSHGGLVSPLTSLGNKDDTPSVKRLEAQARARVKTAQKSASRPDARRAHAEIRILSGRRSVRTRGLRTTTIVTLSFSVWPSVAITRLITNNPRQFAASSLPLLTGRSTRSRRCVCVTTTMSSCALCLLVFEKIAEEYTYI